LLFPFKITLSFCTRNFWYGVRQILPSHFAKPAKCAQHKQGKNSLFTPLTLLFPRAIHTKNFLWPHSCKNCTALKTDNIDSQLGFYQKRRLSLTGQQHSVAEEVFTVAMAPPTMPQDKKRPTKDGGSLRHRKQH